jgi:hypothetical protein
MKGNSIIEKSTNSPAPQGMEILPLQDLGWLMMIILVMLAAVLAQVYAYIPKFRRRQSSDLAQRNDLCYRCKYFNNNLYLKCALHPGTVLTEASVDCKDYCQKD